MRTWLIVIGGVLASGIIALLAYRLLPKVWKWYAEQDQASKIAIATVVATFMALVPAYFTAFAPPKPPVAPPVIQLLSAPKKEIAQDSTERFATVVNFTNPVNNRHFRVLIRPFDIVEKDNPHAIFKIELALTKRLLKRGEQYKLDISTDTLYNTRNPESVERARAIGKNEAVDLIVWGDVYLQTDAKMATLNYALVNQEEWPLHIKNSTGVQAVQSLADIYEGSIPHDIDYIVAWVFGLQAYEGREFDTALMHFASIDEDRRDSEVEVLFRMGACHFMKRDFEQAHDSWEIVIANSSISKWGLFTREPSLAQPKVADTLTGPELHKVALLANLVVKANFAKHQSRDSEIIGRVRTGRRKPRSSDKIIEIPLTEILHTLLYQVPRDFAGRELKNVYRNDTAVHWPAPNRITVQQISSLEKQEAYVVSRALQALLHDDNVSVASGALVALCILEDSLVNARRANLWRASLHGVNLKGADLSEANLKGADLSEANLKGAVLYDANLKGAILYDADLYGADLKGADLYGADLRGVDLRGHNLSGADLRGADLYGADLRGVDLREADLSGADLSGADLSGADLRRAYLIGAFLRRAFLIGADLRRAFLIGADLRRAFLCEANLSVAQDFNQADLDLAYYSSGTQFPDGFSMPATMRLLTNTECDAKERDYHLNRRSP